MNIGEAIKFARHARSLSQRDLSLLSDIAVSTLSMIEAGKRQPSVSALTRLTKELNIPFVALAFLAQSEEELEKLDAELVKVMSQHFMGMLRSTQPSLRRGRKASSARSLPSQDLS